MKICVITPTYPPKLGGTQEFVYNLTSKLALAGHSVTIVTPRLDTRDYPFTDSDRVLRFPYWRTKGLVLFTQNSNCFKRVHSLDKKMRFDVLHQFHVIPLGMACVLLKKKLRKPLVTSLMGWDSFSPDESTSLFYRLSRPVASLVLNSSDSVTSPSIDLARHAYSDGCRRHIEVIPHFVDLDRYDSPELQDQALRLRGKLGLETGERVIMTVCRLDRVKNVETLIRASPTILQRDHHVKFVVAGDGPEHARLVGLARSTNVDSYFRFVGEVLPNEMPAYYAASDLFVLTSLYEAFGLVILEAMAAGRPVIATSAGAIPEIVDDGVTGFLFPPGDATKLAQLALNVLGDENLRTKMGYLGRERVKKQFTWEKPLRQYLGLYNRLM